MDRIAIGFLAAALIAAVLVLALRTWTAHRARGAIRERYLDACLPLFRDLRRRVEATGFPRLSGTHGGQTFDLQAVPDTLTFRKLPALWVLVTMPVPLPVRATLDLMIRPMGVEPFSNFHALPEQVTVPSGLPDDCAIRTDNSNALVPERLIQSHRELFDDPRVKELVISPNGLRITFLAEEANRGRYLIFRDAEMGLEPLAPEELRPKLDALLRLHADTLACADRAEAVVAA